MAITTLAPGSVTRISLIRSWFGATVNVMSSVEAVFQERKRSPVSLSFTSRSPMVTAPLATSVGPLPRA